MTEGGQYQAGREKQIAYIRMPAPKLEGVHKC